MSSYSGAKYEFDGVISTKNIQQNCGDFHNMAPDRGISDEWRIYYLSWYLLAFFMCYSLFQN